MKTLQKTTLAMAIAAAPFFANADLVSLDDAVLGQMTGQAGVTIVTTTDTTGITIGSIEYTDTDGNKEANGGSLVINKGTLDNGIKVTGATRNAGTGAWEDAVVTTKQTIDIDSNGNLITETTNVSGTAKRIRVGNVELRANGQTTAGASLVSNLDLIQLEGDSSAHILNLSNGQTFTGDKHNGVDVSKATASGAKLAIVTKGESRIENLDVDALDGAVQVRGLQYYDTGANGDKINMQSTQVIWAIGGQNKDSSAANYDVNAGIWIQGSDSKGTLEIGSVGIGGSSIGQIKITDIRQAGSVQHIYGH